MTIPAIPKNPKAEDLIPLLAALDERLAALEADVAEVHKLRKEISGLRWSLDNVKRRR